MFFVFFSQGLADNTVIAKVNDELWDLDRPFEGDSQLKLLKFDDPDGKSLKGKNFSTPIIENLPHGICYNACVILYIKKISPLNKTHLYWELLCVELQVDCKFLAEYQ